MGRSRGRRPSNGHKRRSAPRPDASGTLKVNRRGYGFVITPEGDYFVPSSKLAGAMDGDTVVVRPSSTSTGKRKSGKIVRVLVHAHQTLVGAYETNGGLGIVVPLDARINYDIFTSTSAFPEAKTGDVVNVRIISYPSRHESAMGVIEDIVGNENDPDIEMKSLIYRYGLETEFSPASLEQAEKSSVDIDVALEEADRIDLRGRFIFTIDPVDARDFDDAISVEGLDDGTTRLGVHIADVSSYVPWGSSIDLDARRRATSVYLADRVIPMLPEKLSCDLCSLNPGEDRRAFSVDMIIDAQGKVKSAEFHPSVIRSSLRLDYGQVQEMFDGKRDFPSPEAKRALEQLSVIAEQRRHARNNAGGIDFDGVETKVICDESGKVSQIVLRRRSRATSAIEEAMIAANESVATFLEGRCASSVFRVHDVPSAEAIASLLPLLTELDYPTEGLVQLDPHALQRVLDYAEERPEYDLVSMRVLRSMKRAVYQTHNIGHFGLALASYTHFTSPIRRYPDLLVHRILRAVLAGYLDSDGVFSSKCAKKSPVYGVEALKGLRQMLSELDWLCEHSSQMERVAADAAFDSVQIKLCEYMSDFIGETFSGLVTSVSSAGLFVTLDNTVKGLVDIRTLGEEYFIYDSEHQTLCGEETNTVYRIGQQVQVVLKAVNVRDMTIDFEIV